MAQVLSRLAQDEEHSPGSLIPVKLTFLTTLPPSTLNACSEAGGVTPCLMSLLLALVPLTAQSRPLRSSQVSPLIDFDASLGTPSAVTILPASALMNTHLAAAGLSRAGHTASSGHTASFPNLGFCQYTINVQHQ